MGSTNLVGWSSVLRPSGGAVKPNIINTMGHPALPGSSPFKQIALSALEANKRQNMGRDVSMMASTLRNADGNTKAAVAGMENAVVEKAKGMAGVTAPFGFLVGEQFLPLFGGDINVPSLLAFQETPLQNFWPAVVAALAIPEIFSVFSFEEPKGLNRWEETWTMKSDHQPGDLGFDPLGLKPKDAAEFKEMQTKEINNGRLAMIAAAGMIAQEVATGQKLF